MKKRKWYIVTMLFKERFQHEYRGIQNLRIPEQTEDDWIWFFSQYAINLNSKRYHTQ